MNIKDEIDNFLATLPEPKRSELLKLHQTMLELMPGCRLWFLDGRNSESKVVSNPSLGYGQKTMRYADGSSREFYQIGLSPNKTGISVYILGIEDKKFLANTYGNELGKASVSGYCIKFKSLKDIDIEVLSAAVRAGIEASR